MRSGRDGWTGAELKILGRLKRPDDVQAFLDRTTYSSDEWARCPRRVLRDRVAHCWDGALFAAAALRRIGFPPLVLDMRAVRDDDHVIALFKRNGCWGAVAKSNFVGLRYREPIFRTVRELVLSYFEFYYNLEGEKSLRSYSGPFDLARFDRHGWMRGDEHLQFISDRLDDARHFPLVTRAMIRTMSRIDRRSYDAGMLGVNAAGLFKPKRG